MNLSIILPAYNEEDRILQTLERYASYFPKIARKFELIVVVNNSRDRTLDRALVFKKKHPFIKILNIPYWVGKGGAIIAGLNTAQHSTLGFLDADDAFELNDIKPILADLNSKKSDVGIASKWKNQRFADVDEPFARKILSRGWNALVRLALDLRFADTQAGAKFFTKDAWSAIPKDFIGKGFEFDIDLLSRFHDHGLRIREYHVRNRYRAQSKFHLRHSVPMFFKLIRIALRTREQHPAHYYRMYHEWWHPAHFFYKHKINKIISFVPENAALLDAGCGSGVLVSVAAKKKNCAITGVDIRSDQVQFAKRLCPSGTFIQQDVRGLRLNKKFAVVNCSDVIEHFERDERNAVLNRLDQHVADNGTLILAFPSWFYISVFERFWKVARKILSPRTHFDDDDIHRVVPPQDVIRFYKKRSYTLIEHGTFCAGLLRYIVMKKRVPK